MYAGNPFAKNTLRIREDAPRCPASFKGKKAIEIVSDLCKQNRKPRVEGVNRVLQRVPRKANIKLVGVRYDCLLPELPAFELFQQARYVHIAGWKIRDYDRLRLLRGTTDFFLCGYNRPTLSEFKHFKLDYFRAIRGRIETFDLSTRCALLQDCRHLTHIASVTIRKLTLDCTQKVALQSIANVRGLEELQLTSIRSIPSFDFLEKLGALENLVVTANSLTRTDISYLCDVGVKRMFLGVATRTIRKIGHANPNVTVTNGKIEMQGGKEYEGCRRYWEGEKQPRGYHL